MDTLLLNTQVTCTKILHPFLLIGQGSWLQVHRLSDTEEIARYRVFTSTSIHGIEPLASENDSSFKLCVCGGKAIRIVQFDAFDIPTFSALSEPVSFPDWIWIVKWFDRDHIGLILSQNYVICYDIVGLKIVNVSQCEDKCILYCGILVGTRWEDTAVFAGTVFQQILVWCLKTENGKPCRVLHRLTGHDGVLFSIHYDHKMSKLCSSSDDRSIQIWHHESNSKTDEESCSNEDLNSVWHRSTFTLLFKLYGHDSRVWKVTSFGSTFVSAGEDSRVCYWKFDEKDEKCSLERSVSCHGESSIRSLSIDDDRQLMVTGGGNGEVKLWHLGTDVSAQDAVIHRQLALGCNNQTEMLCSSDFPREIRLVNFDNMFITTNEGVFLLHCFSTGQTVFLMRDECFRSYSVVDISRDSGESTTSLCVGDLSGAVTFLSIEVGPTDGKVPFQNLGRIKIFDEKVLALKLLRDGPQTHLLVCGPDGKMIVLEFRTTGKIVTTSQLHHLELPHCRLRWFTAATLLRHGQDKLSLICGSRNGSIHVYQKIHTTTGKYCAPTQSFHKLHGTNGVTDILIREDDSGATIFTAGRDGFLRSFLWTDDEELRLLQKNRIGGCPKWISGLNIVDDEMLVSGFHTDYFVLWNEKSRSALVRVSCGGGHRSWDMQMANEDFRFCYIKERGVFHYDARVDGARPLCIKSGLHHRQINSVQHLFSGVSTTHLCTCSEDGTAMILGVRNDVDVISGASVRCVSVLKSHISSVKGITSCPWHGGGQSGGDRLLVTVGGRAQLVCWRMRVTLKEGAEDDVRIEELTSHMLHPEGRRSKKPWLRVTHTVDPETRYMDVAVWSVQDESNGSHYVIAVACSDSFIRLFSLDASTLTVALLVADPAHGHCVLKVKHLPIGHGQSLLLSSATDGRVLFWDVCFQPKAQDDAACRLVFETQLHQSGVTALDVTSHDVIVEGVTCLRLIVATGGDDTTVQMVVLDVMPDAGAGHLQVVELCRTSLPARHTAQVTGIFLTPNFVWSASVDHRVCGWSYNLHSNPSRIELLPITYLLSNVHDISSMTGWSHSAASDQHDEDVQQLVVVGLGMEMFRTKSPEKI